MAEELRLSSKPAGASVQSNTTERLRRAGARFMDRFGERLFSRARLTFDQNGDIRRGEPFAEWIETPHLRTGANDLPELRCRGGRRNHAVAQPANTQLGCAQGNDFAAAEKGGRDTDVVHEGPIRRIEIDQLELATHDVDRRMTPRHLGVAQAQAEQAGPLPMRMRDGSRPSMVIACPLSGPSTTASSNEHVGSAGGRTDPLFEDGRQFFVVALSLYAHFQSKRITP